MMVTDAESRELFHTRRVEAAGYRRSDKLWDIEGSINDTKSYDYDTREKVLKAGRPLHQMFVRLVVDDNFRILAIEARTDDAPFRSCPACNAKYDLLVGLNLLNGFKKKSRELIPLNESCTHINDLLGVMATTAIQTIAGWLESVNPTRKDGGSYESSVKFNPTRVVDTCHGMRSDGAHVRINFPDHYKPPG